MDGKREWITTRKVKNQLKTMFYVSDVNAMVEEIIYQIESGIASRLDDNTYIPVIFDIPAWIHVTSNYITNIRYAEI